jgi:hypothetical protein
MPYLPVGAGARNRAVRAQVDQGAARLDEYVVDPISGKRQGSPRGGDEPDQVLGLVVQAPVLVLLSTAEGERRPFFVSPVRPTPTQSAACQLETEGGSPFGGGLNGPFGRLQFLVVSPLSVVSGEQHTR